VEKISYTRFECSFSRSPDVLDENMTPRVWQNDTYSLVHEYATYFKYPFVRNEVLNVTFPTPTSQELFRFYQAYMLSISTNHDFAPIQKEISVWMNTVQVSTVFLAVVAISTVLILWLTGRYLFFSLRHKSEFEKTFVPDTKLGFLLRAAQIAASDGQIVAGTQNAKDRDLLSTTNFGYSHLKPSHIYAKSRLRTEISSSGNLYHSIRICVSTTDGTLHPKVIHQMPEIPLPDIIVSPEPITYTSTENSNLPFHEDNSESTECSFNS